MKPNLRSMRLRLFVDFGMPRHGKVEKCLPNEMHVIRERKLLLVDPFRGCSVRYHTKYWHTALCNRIH